MQEIDVSIVCLTYNHEKYIRRCLEGFVQQKTTYKCEVLINDDASTDNTAAIIREYAVKYPGLIKPFFQKENQYSKGKVIFRDILEPFARGKYLAFCEGDDYWCDNNKIQLQVDFLEKHLEYSGVVHNTQIVNESEKKLGRCFYGKTRDITMLNSMLDFPHTSSYVLRNPFIQTRPDLKKAALSISYWDKSYALYMIKTGKVRYFDRIMSYYRYITNRGTSYQARMKSSNYTKMKIGAELAHYNQIEKYKLPINMASHYYRNVCEYALKFYLSSPLNENKKLLRQAFKESPFGMGGFILYEIRSFPGKVVSLFKNMLRRVVKRIFRNEK